MPPKTPTRKLLRMPKFSTPKTLRLDSFLSTVHNANKGNSEAWAATKWDDVADEYLAAHEAFHRRGSRSHSNALSELASPAARSLRGRFESYRSKASANRKPGAEAAAKTPDGAGPPGLRQDHEPAESADEVLRRFEERAREAAGGRLSKREEGALGNMRKERKVYWRREKEIDKRKEEWMK
ncbi:hypothetical protein NpPPO83_00008148 [Neofusicoccum parvum]|uniref:Uncharacterized protein n=1 Tax=Neofusicoccum parvum TaxID=310453 RepID=A0ACB5RSW9_9PEZI|nr:hypothetical protein NpPPO83_00008148 [Neofusicoccum parvum]